MKKTMPRKPPKKSPAKRMKPWTGWCDIDDKSGEPYRRVFPTSKACLDHRATKGWKLIQVLVTELPTPTDSHARDEGRKLEEVRKYLAAVVESEATEPAINVALGGLRILNTTPTAKGGRK